MFLDASWTVNFFSWPEFTILFIDLQNSYFQVNIRTEQKVYSDLSINSSSSIQTYYIYKHICAISPISNYIYIHVCFMQNMSHFNFRFKHLHVHGGESCDH